MLNMVEFRLRVLYWVQTKDGGKGANQPTPTNVPAYAHEKELEAVKMDVRAEAWRRRQAKR